MSSDERDLKFAKRIEFVEEATSMTRNNYEKSVPLQSISLYFSTDLHTKRLRRVLKFLKSSSLKLARLLFTILSYLNVFFF